MIQGDHAHASVSAFANKRPHPPHGIDGAIHSTGDTFMRGDRPIMWWVGDDLYATMGDTPYASVWANNVCAWLELGDRVFREYPLRYNGRPIGRDEVIHITGIAATRSRS